MVERSHTPDGTPIELFQREQEFSINAGGRLLMSSRMHGSEEALAVVALEALGPKPRARVLVGGLGCGFTLAAALARLERDAEVTVVELVPAIVRWNRERLGALSGFPLNDPRVTVVEGDVIEHLGASKSRYDAILLDIDNGPIAFTQASNGWLYSPAGLERIRRALGDDGVVSVWSAGGDAGFSATLLEAGFEVIEHRVRARRERAGLRHVVWVGKKLGGAQAPSARERGRSARRPRTKSARRRAAVSPGRS